MSRSAADEDGDDVSTLRIELARDADEDPRGDVASYAPVGPHYGLEERDPAPRRAPKPKGKRASAEGWLNERLAAGPARVSDVLRDGSAVGYSESTLQRAKRAVGVQPCTLELHSAWRLA